jgi:energy-converting hydrogenase Eha subunit H
VTDEAADLPGDGEKLPKPPIVIPWKGHLVVAIVCVIFAIGAAVTKGLLGVAIAVALLALAAVDIRSGLHKRKIVAG